MSDTDLIFQVEGAVAQIVLNRPAKKNAITEEMSERLAECLQRIRRDDDIRAAIITGQGGVFSAGADLKQRTSGGGVRTRRAAAAAAAGALILINSPRMNQKQ